MNDFLILKYSKIKDNSIFLKKIRYYALLRFLIRLIANIILPIWFNISRIFKKERIDDKIQSGKRIIVSFTTFPTRIGRVWLIIECVLRQSVKPDKIILWLSKEQFPSERNIPRKLLSLRKLGLEIVLCENDLRSHKKYFYSLQLFPDDLIITIDDDLLYPSFFIRELISLHNKFPKAIACHRGLKINRDTNKNIKYNNFKYIYGGYGPSNDIFFTTGGGTLFRKENFHNEVTNLNVFMTYCKYADDVWLNIMAQFNKTEIVKSKKHFEPIPLFYLGNIALSTINVEENYNDKQIIDVMSYYGRTFDECSLFN